VEVLGREYSFGGHPYDYTGVFAVQPRHAPEVKFREAIFMGTTKKTHAEVRQILQLISDDFPGNTYAILSRNCNHFSGELVMRLCGKSVPDWINRAAFLAKLVNCVYPIIPTGPISAIQEAPHDHPGS